MIKQLVFILILLFSFGSNAQEKKTRILFILDASNSMNSKIGSETRIAIAKEVLAKSVDSLRGVPNLEIALRVYGHQSPITATYQDCEDTKLEIPFGVDNHDKIKNRIRSILAKGTTPIARSLEASAGDFPDTLTRNVIILITDGLEACDNDPCVIAKKLKDKGVKVTPFVIGLGMDLSYLEKFNCIGPYFDAETKESFKKALNTVISTVLVKTTVQINLNDTYKNPKETDVTMFLYKAGTTELMYTMEHTLNRYGNPDTIAINPNIKYDLVVNTTPKLMKKNITLVKNTHNTIVLDAPQGYINVRLVNASNNYAIETRVMQAGNPTTLNVQKINDPDKYLTGKYQLEILTLPRIYKTIDVDQSSTTQVDVMAPGILSYRAVNFSSAQIFVQNENGLFDWVCNIDPLSLTGSWQLQPGEYRLVYRYNNMKSTAYTSEKVFRIQSNKTTTLNF